MFEQGEIEKIDEERDDVAHSESASSVADFLLLNPDAIILGGPYDDPDASRTMIIAGSQESTNVAQFDWIAFYAALYNKEDMSNRIAGSAQQNFDCASENSFFLSSSPIQRNLKATSTRRVAEEEDKKPTLLWASWFEGYGWSVSYCPNYQADTECEWAAACNVHILSRPEGVGNAPESLGGRYWYLTDEEFFEFAKDADVWVYKSQFWDSVYELKAEYLQQFHKGFAVFQYLTLRGILGVLTALALSLWLGPWMIRTLQIRQIGQSVRNDGPQSHLSKKGTPTMGGALILTAIAVSTLLWADLSNRYVWTVLAVTLLFGAIGWVDDYRKVIEKNSRGLPSRWKYFWQSVFGLGAAIFLYTTAQSPVETTLILPMVKDFGLELGLGFIVLTYFVIVGSSNAVNLTDGLDGLAILPTVMVGGALGIFCYLSGNVNFAEYLFIPYVPGAGELIVFCAAMVGAGLGFLWFNTYPAQVFMGDVGALALGAALGTIAVIVRQEIVLFIMGGIFVLETLSVIIQVASFKLTGKRVFRMAPIHHHFELKGWPEPRVIVRFWIITVILVLIGLATLKLR